MAEDEADVNFNVYVGSENGVLKAIYYGAAEDTPMLKNFHSFTKQKKASKADVVSLNWGLEDNEKELIVGSSNGIVKIYSTKIRAFLQGTSVPMDLEKHGKLVSVYNYENNFIYGTSNGSVFTWNYVQDSEPTEISTGSHLAKLIRCPTDTNIYATGGKETELQVWNLETPDKPIFKARNVRNDFLDLRVPVWVQDITFLRDADDLLAISTRYGQVRLYDTRAKNRPVVDMQYLDHPLMAISTVSTHNRQVLVGSARGTLGQIDLRNPKGIEAQKYDGFVGGIRSICAHPTRPIFTSCGLDRHIYLHELRDKTPIKKLYLKLRLQCVIMSKTLDSVGPNHSIGNVCPDVLPIECRNVNQIKTPTELQPQAPQPYGHEDKDISTTETPSTSEGPKLKKHRKH